MGKISVDRRKAALKVLGLAVQEGLRKPDAPESVVELALQYGRSVQITREDIIAALDAKPLEHTDSVEN